MPTFSDLFRNFVQIGYVTDDIDAAADYLEGTLGTVECRKSYKASLGGIVVVDGEMSREWVIDVAIVHAGATQIEIIKPVSGAIHVYREGIRPDVPATFHHLGFDIADFDEATALVAAAGKSWRMNGHLKGSSKFGYVDMRPELGHYVEFMKSERVSA